MLTDNQRKNLFLGGLGNDAHPWLAPPPGFVPVDRNRSTVVLRNSGETLLESIQLTESMEGYIVLSGIISSSYTDFFFTIKQGGIPLRDYSRITVPLGQPDRMDPIGPIKIEANQPLELFANGIGVTADNIGIRYRLYGWYFKSRPGMRL